MKNGGVREIKEWQAGDHGLHQRPAGQDQRPTTHDSGRRACFRGPGNQSGLIGYQHEEQLQKTGFIGVQRYDHLKEEIIQLK
jgi:hypothetical protein